MTVIEDDWDYNLDYNSIEKKAYYEFESTLSASKNNLLQELKDGFIEQTFVYNALGSQNPDNELREIVEKNRVLRNQIEEKLKKLSQQQLKYENYKKDQNFITQEIKETHEAYLMAKKYYKRFLKMYHTIEASNGETQTIFLQFFTEAKRDSENYSVRLWRDSKTRNYKLISTTPKLDNLEELSRILQETNDVSGALCSIRRAFMTLKTCKK